MSKFPGLVAAVALALASPAAAQTPNGAVPLPGARVAVAASSTQPGPARASVARPEAAGRLPFTPLDVAVIGVGSLVLVAAGFVLRRLGRPPLPAR